MLRNKLMKSSACAPVNFVPDDVYMNQLQVGQTFDAEERISQIEIPTLVISGDADSIVPVEILIVSPPRFRPQSW
jgi:pimeloyl-ACP methyl ester carboxylesterase